MSIHPAAIVDPRAVLGADVSIGPFAVVSGEAVIGDRCVIGAHAQILGRVALEHDNEVGPGAILGGDPQDLSFDPARRSGVRIGPGNRIREHATIHRGVAEGGETVLGANNFLMVGAHVGHDARIGDGNVLANNCLLGGHVQVGNHAFLGGGAAFHQFVRVGDRCIIQGHGGVSQDVPPFVIGHRVNRIAGLNVIGMRRAGLDASERAELKELFRLFYRERRPLREALEIARARSLGPAGRSFVDFFLGPSRKGVCMRHRRFEAENSPGEPS